MTMPPPIRYDRDTWICMRGDPVLPAAIIPRQRAGEREYFRAVTWDLDPARRLLIGRYPSLELANEAVLYARQEAMAPSIPVSMLAAGDPRRIAAGRDG